MIKEQIVTVMLNSPEAVQKQLSDAISLIGKHDFPDSWPNLLPKIIENFASFAGMYLTLCILIHYHAYIIKYSSIICFSCTNG